MKKTSIVIALVCISFFSFTESKKEVTIKKEAKVFQAACRTHCASDGFGSYVQFIAWDIQMGAEFPQVPRNEDLVHNYYDCPTLCAEMCTRVCYGMM